MILRTRYPSPSPLVVLGTLLLAALGARAQQGTDEASLSTAVEQAQALRESGKLIEASRRYEEVVATATRLFGPDHLNTASLMNNLGTLYQDLGRYTQAEALLRRSLEIREARLGPDDPRVALALNNLATVCEEMGQYTRAAPLLRRSLTIEEAQLGPDHPRVAIGLNNLATVYFRMGRFSQAEPLYLRSLKIREARLGPDHPDVGIGLDNLASLYRTLGRTAQAEPLYQRSLKIAEARRGPDHPDVATVLSNLAGLYEDMGRFAQAEPLYRRSLKIRESRFGPDHLSVANSLNNLAGLLAEMDQPAQALPLYRRCLEIAEARLGPEHPHVATSLSNLAALYLETGQFAQAEPLLRRGLEIREARLGPDHPDMVQSLINLAALYQAMGRLDQAEPLLRRGLEIGAARLGPDHPDVAQAWFNLALLHAALERWPEAVEETDRVRRAFGRHVDRVLPALVEAEQLEFLRTRDRHFFSGALSLGLSRRDVLRAATASAGWVLNGKAVTLEALAQQALLARDLKDPAAAEIVPQLRTVRAQLAALTHGGPGPGPEADRRPQLARLTEQEQALAKRLAQAVGRPFRDDPWVELDEVRNALSEDDVLIEIAKFHVLGPKKKGQALPLHYAAWVIPARGQGDVQVVDLGPAGPIEDAVAAARKALQPDAETLRDLLRTRGEPEAERRLRPTLEALGRLILTPLLPQIGRAGRWIVSPDAALWLVPWASLPLEDGRYAIEAHPIHYVVSGRDLVRSPAQRASGRALVIADPDYDLDPERARAASRSLLQGVSPTPTPDPGATRGISRSFPTGRTVPRLPGSAAEAQAVLPKLKAYTGADPILYADQWALESVFKAFRRPRVVLLSTHGFVLDAPESQPEDQPIFSLHDHPQARPGPPPENPLLRCGLLLAGANRRRQASSGDDGVLTGLEIVGTDLRGTDLVVLSACETGLGRVRTGEGVAGLRQAFQLAGAQTVVATLWQVPDKESARLMAGFFDHLAAGQGKAQALREAQLEQIGSRRERYGAAHPFFWAAYTLTGLGG